MSWLEERKLTAMFKCLKCRQLHNFDYTPKDWTNEMRRPLLENEEFPCECGGTQVEYVGTKPFRVGGCVKELFEQNGRMGIRTRDMAGNVSYRSLTKENYLKTGDTSSKLTKGYEEHVHKTMAESAMKRAKAWEDSRIKSDASMALEAAAYERSQSNKKNVTITRVNPAVEGDTQ